jgi:histidine triad (HIT) family protein
MDDSGAPCVFCDIVGGRAPADIVWADEVGVAFLDRTPLFWGHTLVVPTRHTLQLSDLPGAETGPFFRRVQMLATVMPGALGASGTFVAMNNIVSQSVAHLHVHVVPRTKGDGLRGFFWPRQKYGEVRSAEFAERLRAALASFDTASYLADR